MVAALCMRLVLYRLYIVKKRGIGAADNDSYWRGEEGGMCSLSADFLKRRPTRDLVSGISEFRFLGGFIDF